MQGVSDPAQGQSGGSDRAGDPHQGAQVHETGTQVPVYSVVKPELQEPQLFALAKPVPLCIPVPDPLTSQNKVEAKDREIKLPVFLLTRKELQMVL